MSEDNEALIEGLYRMEIAGRKAVIALESLKRITDEITDHFRDEDDE